MNRNLLVKREKNSRYFIKISDFGMSKSTDKGYYVVTKEEFSFPVKWSAPEVYVSNEVTIKSDVWSFGIVLWEIFSYGETPYPEMGNKDILQKVPSGYRMKIPSLCSPAIAHLMESCWSLSPRARPTFDHIYQQLKEELKGTRYSNHLNEIELNEVNLSTRPTNLLVENDYQNKMI